MALWVEHLLCKHNDLSSNQQHPCGRCPLICTHTFLNLLLLLQCTCYRGRDRRIAGSVATSLVPSLARDPISREWGQRMVGRDASVFRWSPCIWTCSPKDMCEHIIYRHTHVHTYTFIKMGKCSKSNTLHRNM